MITIVNYGLGNIGAFVNMYKRMNIVTRIATQPGDLTDATHVILPGVGAFDHAMQLLNASGMRHPLEELARGQKVPMLGICVGMQILADSSEEGSERGLGWIKGRVRSFAGCPASSELPMPHMGWNDVRPTAPCALLNGLEADARFYFLHSYFFECAAHGDMAAGASYGLDFACVVQHGRIYGVQFHPEKSHHWGGALLKNFAAM